jgi:hypothetical protein
VVCSLFLSQVQALLTNLVGGDSGAWIVQNGTHKVVGHVLAWCARNHIAYICPMEVLLQDIKRTLGAKRIYLPGSVEQVKYTTRHNKLALKNKETSRVEELEVAVGSLGLLDEGVVVDEPPQVSQQMQVHVPRRGRGLGIGMLGGSGESDKENMPVLRSRLVKVGGATAARGREMVGVP